MKTINFFTLALLVTFSFINFSCSNDDDDSSNTTPAETQLTINTANLAGKWYEIGYTVSGVDLSSQIPSLFQPCSTTKSYFEFTSGGVIKRKQYDNACVVKDYQGTYTINNSILSYENLMSSTSFFFVHLGTPTGSQITSLTASTMKTKFTSGQSSMEVTYKKL